MDNRFREVIEIRPRPRRGLLACVLALGAGAVVALWFADVTPVWKSMLACGAAALLFDWIRRRVSPGGSHYVERANLLPDGRWIVFVPGKGPVGAHLRAAWGASLGPVIALEWQCIDGARRQAWLLEPDVSAPVWRRLRVRLRLS